MASSLWGLRQTEDEQAKARRAAADMAAAAITAPALPAAGKQDDDVGLPDLNGVQVEVEPDVESDELPDLNGVQVELAEDENIPEVTGNIPDPDPDTTMTVGEHARDVIRQETGKRADDILTGSDDLYTRAMGALGVSREGAAAALVHFAPFGRQISRMYANIEERNLGKLLDGNYTNDELDDIVNASGQVLRNSDEEIKRLVQTDPNPIRARRKFLQMAAEDELRERAKTRQSASADLKNREDTRTRWGKIVGGTLENSGYVNSFIYGSTIAGGLGIGVNMPTSVASKMAAARLAGKGTIGALRTLTKGEVGKYVLNQMANTAITSAPVTFSDQAANMTNLMKKDYEVDAQGNLKVIDNNYGALSSILLGGADAVVADFVIEGMTDTAVQMGLLGLSKIPAVQALVVKPLSKMTSGAVKKLMGNWAGRSLLKVGKAYNSLEQVTHFHSQPVEMLEEYLDPIRDIVGLTQKRGEWGMTYDENGKRVYRKGFMDGLGKELGKYKDQMLSSKGFADTFYGLIGTCLVQGGAGAALSHRSYRAGVETTPKEARSVLTDYAGVDKAHVAVLSDEDAIALAEKYIQWRGNPEQLRKDAEKIGKVSAEIADRIVNREYADMSRRIETAKLPMGKFTIPMRQGANGRQEIAFQDEDGVDELTGDPVKRKFVEDGGVRIYDNGNAGAERPFTVVNPQTGNSVDCQNLNQARKLATIYKSYNALQGQERSNKALYINQLRESKYGNVTIKVANTPEEAIEYSLSKGVDVVGQEKRNQLRRKRAELGRELTPQEVRETEEAAARNVLGRKAWHITNGPAKGQVVFVSDNIKSPYDVNSLFQHEIIGHNAETMADDFINNLDSDTANNMFKALIDQGLITEDEVNDPTVRREVFANIIQQRRHNPSLMQKLKHWVNQKRREAGETKAISDADIEVLAAKWEKDAMGDRGETIPPETRRLGPEPAKPTVITADLSETAKNVEESGENATLGENQQTEERNPAPAETSAETAAPFETRENGPQSVPSEKGTTSNSGAENAAEGENSGNGDAQAKEVPEAMRTEHDFLRVMHNNAEPVRVPIKNVKLPDTQFKEGADPKTGVVEGQRLQGEYYESAENAVVVYERENGELELVTGRHRFDLAKRNGKNDILARVFREMDGYTQSDMRNLDAISNIIDEKGSVKDYVKYFENAKPSRAAAQAGGFLSRPKGRLAFELYEGATEDTRASVDWSGSGTDGLISPEQAGIIAEAAPKDAHPRNKALQRILVTKALNGLRGRKLSIVARSLAEEVKTAKTGGGAGGAMQLDLFSSAEDLELLAMEDKRAEYRVGKANEYKRIAEVLRTAIGKGGKLDLNAEYAKELGITDPKDKKQLKKARDRAIQQANYWENAIRLNASDKSEMDAAIRESDNRKTKKNIKAETKSPAGKSQNEDLPFMLRFRAESATMSQNGMLRETMEKVGREEIDKALSEYDDAAKRGNSFAKKAAERIRNVLTEIDRKATVSSAGTSWKDAAGKERKIPGYSPPDAVPVQNGSRVVIKAKDGSIHVGVVKGMDGDTVTISTYSEEDGEGERAFPKSAIVGVRGADGMNASRRRGASSHEPLHTSIMRDAYTFKRTNAEGIGRVFGVDAKGNQVFVIYRKDENSDDGYVIIKTIRQNSKNRKVIDFYEREISRGVRSDEDGAGLVGQADRNENESANRRGGNGDTRRGRATPENAGLAEGESASKGNADDRKGDGAESEPRIDIRSWHDVTVSNGMKDNDGRIFDLFNHLNRNADSQRIADKVFALARKLGFTLYVESGIEEYGWQYGNVVAFNSDYLSDVAVRPQDKADTILHEFIHHVTAYAIDAVAGRIDTKGVEVSKELREAVEDLASIYEQTENALRRNGKTNYAQTYELSDDNYESQGDYWAVRNAPQYARLKEFLAELANPEVRKALKEQSLWERCVNGVKRVIKSVFDVFGEGGLNGKKDGDAERNALDVALDNLDRFLDNLDYRLGGEKYYDMLQERMRRKRRKQRKKAKASVIDGMKNDVNLYIARKNAAKRLSNPTSQDVMDAMEGKWDKFRRAVQDKNVIIRQIEELLGVTDKRKSVYYAKDREFGLNEHQLTVLQKRHVDPIFKRLAKTGASQEDFDLYLMARHAPYRNAVVLGRTGANDGSGMSDADAAKVIDKFRRLGLEPEFSAIADMVYAMNDEALQRRVDSGRITQTTADDLRATLVDYVPLRTDMENAERDTFNTYSAGWHRNEFRSAKGRSTLADSPLAWSIVQAERSIKDANANDVRQVAAELVRHAERIGKPIGEIVSGTQMKKRWAFDINGEVWTMDELKDRPNIVFFKENGKFKAIVVNEGKNGLGNVFAKAVADKDLVKFNEWFEWVPKLTRAMASMRTQYVPTFIIRNMKADTLEVMLNVLSERGAKGGAGFMGRLLENEWKNRRDVRDYFENGVANGWMKEFVENGGLTGGGMAAEGFSETAKRIRSTIRTASGGNVRKFAAAVPDAISLLNSCAEYNTRVGIYSVLRQEGVSVEDAISYARDATVNFNRRGYLTPYINAAYMFSNASIQGMGRAFKSMGSKYGKGVVASLFVVGVIQALLDYFLGHDDDREKQGLSDAKNLTEHAKLSSIGVPLPDGLRLVTQIRNPWALPMYLGRKATEVVIGWADPRKAAKDVVSAIGNFVTEPLGGNGLDSVSETLQSIAPTALDPVVQWTTGKDFKGDDRLRKNFDKYKPDSQNGKYNTPDAYKWIAQSLNWLSGGNEYRKGALDTSPENWQLLAETVFGGALTDLNRIVATVKDVSLAVQGAKPDQVVRDIPFVRDTVTNSPDISARFYDALERYEADVKEYRGISDAAKRLEYARSHPWVGRDEFKELAKRIKNNQKREQGFEKSGKEWVPRERRPAEVLAIRRWRLADEAKFVSMMEEPKEEEPKKVDEK